MMIHRRVTDVSEIDAIEFRYSLHVQGRVVRKSVIVNPRLNVNWSIMFSSLKIFFISNVWCSLKLLQLKTEGQTK